MTAEQAIAIIHEIAERAKDADKKRQNHLHRQIRYVSYTYAYIDAEKIDDGIYDFHFTN